MRIKRGIALLLSVMMSLSVLSAGTVSAGISGDEKEAKAGISGAGQMKKAAEPVGE